MTVNKEVRKGKVGLVISSGYGLGWYTYHENEALLFDPKLIYLLEMNVNRYLIKQYCEASYKDFVWYTPELSVVWLPENTSFYINNYDGLETIITADQQKWLIA